MNRKFATAMVALAATAGILSVSTPSASAWSYSPVSGTRGGVAVPNVFVGDLNHSGLTKFTLYSSTGPTVYRSAASSGTQVVAARYAVQQWSGSTWVTVKQSPLMTGQIGAAQSGVTFVAAYLQPDMARGYFRLVWGFDWKTTSGTLLGSSFVVPTLTTDHRCVTPVRLCSSQAGYVRTGGYLSGAW